MSAPVPPPKKKDWPRYAVSPTGERARFDCPGDVMPGWTPETPLAGSAAPVLDGVAIEGIEHTVTLLDLTKPKNKGGRARKVAP